MRIDGHCHCGQITFQAEVEPGTVRICHCTDCQMLSGTAYRTAIAAPAESFVLRGTPKTYVKTADSGGQRVHAFCPNCGTPVYSAAVGETPSYTLRVGTIRQRRALGPPNRQIWCGSAQAWAFDLSAIAATERQ